MTWISVLQWLEPFIFIPIIALTSLGVVYIFGRMLGWIKNIHVKTSFAIISIFSGMWLYTFIYRQKEYNSQTILETIMFSCLSILFYVLVCFRLFDRVDLFFDRFAKDKGDPTKNPPLKKKRKKRKKEL